MTSASNVAIEAPEVSKPEAPSGNPSQPRIHSTTVCSRCTGP